MIGLLGLAGTALGQPVPEVLCGYRAEFFAVEQYEDDDVSDLKSPIRDARLLAGLLEREFGFVTQVHENPTRSELLARLEAMESLPECTSLLIYYAGHGELLDINVPGTGTLKEGYWLPTNASANSRAQWIPFSQLITHLTTIQARHVLLVSDSCHAGSVLRQVDMRGVRVPDDAPLPDSAGRRSRVAITSGAEEPVPDEYTDGYSPFAFFLYKELERAEPGVFSPEGVFFNVKTQVKAVASVEPQLGQLFDAGHDLGSFLFQKSGVAADADSDDAATDPEFIWRTALVDANSKGTEFARWRAKKKLLRREFDGVNGQWLIKEKDDLTRSMAKAPCPDPVVRRRRALIGGGTALAATGLGLVIGSFRLNRAQFGNPELVDYDAYLRSTVWPLTAVGYASILTGTSLVVPTTAVKPDLCRLGGE